EGNTVTYGFTITNTSPASTDPVTITSVVDNVLGNLTSAANAAWLTQGHSGPIVLAPGQAFSFNFTTLTALNAGTVVNTVSVAGHDDENTPASASDTATVPVTNVIPTITVEKTGPATIAEGGGRDGETPPASATDPAAVTVTNVIPTITVEKTGPATIAEGGTATYGFTITNTSAASTDPVTITSVVDNVLGNLTSAANAAWLAQGHSG